MRRGAQSLPCTPHSSTHCSKTCPRRYARPKQRWKTGLPLDHVSAHSDKRDRLRAVFRLCAEHAQQLGGESPLSSLMGRRTSERKGVVARRGLKEACSKATT